MMGQTLLHSGSFISQRRKPNQADIQRDRSNRKLVQRLTSVKSIFDPNGRELHEYQNHRRTCHLHQVFDDYMGRRCPPHPRPRAPVCARPQLRNPCPTGSLDALLCPWDLPSKTSMASSKFFSSAMLALGSTEATGRLKDSGDNEKAFAAPPVMEEENIAGGSEDKAAMPAIGEEGVTASEDKVAVSEAQVAEGTDASHLTNAPSHFVSTNGDSEPKTSGTHTSQNQNPEGFGKVGEALDFFSSGASASKPTDFRSLLGAGDFKPEIKHSAGSALKPPDFRSSEGASTGSALRPPDFRSSEGASAALKPVDLHSSGGTLSPPDFRAGSSALQPPDFRSSETQPKAQSIPDVRSDAAALKPPDFGSSPDAEKPGASGKLSSPLAFSGSQQALNPPDFRSAHLHSSETGSNLQGLDSKSPEAQRPLLDGTPQDSAASSNTEAAGSKLPDWLVSGGQAASSPGNPKRAEDDMFGDMFANLDGDKPLKPPDFGKPKRRRG